MSISRSICLVEKVVMKSIRQIMGIGSYTISGRGMTSYCMSDGKTPCTKEDYRLVEKNLMATLGQPEWVDQVGAQYWFHPPIGLIILPTDNDSPYKYVEVDKHCTREYFDKVKAGIE